MAAPPFSLPRPAPHSPHVSTTVCPPIYAIAIAAIGQVIPYHGFLPVPATWMRRGCFLYCRRSDIGGQELFPSISRHPQSESDGIDRFCLVSQHKEIYENETDTSGTPPIIVS